MSKIIAGDYAGATDAVNRVESLIAEGYPRESISVIANKAVASRLAGSGLTVEKDLDYLERDPDESLWERFKNFFGADHDAHIQDQYLKACQKSIRNGNVLVLVDDALLTADMRAALRDRSADRWEAAAAADTDNETMRLQEERMNVDKQSVQAGEAVVRKKVVEEMKTVEVPVKHEEVVIEERPMMEENPGSADFKEETITIPVMEEQVKVTKRPVVTEEVRVRKRDVEEIKEVSASLKKEKLDVGRVGDVIIEDTTDTQPTDRI